MGNRRFAMFGVVLVLLTMMLPAAGAQERQETAGSQCSQSSTGAIPITDLGSGTYQGAEGGLYPSGSNTVPSEHAQLGLVHASMIEPLDMNGNPDPDGEIVLVSIGVSNTWREFDDFITISQGKVAPSVTLVNGAQGGRPIAAWTDPRERTWDRVEETIASAGLSSSQVQAAWVKVPERIQGIHELEPFPIDAETYGEDLVEVLRIAMERFPNLEIAYLSSRIYGGYNDDGNPNPEPLAYENGFGVKWTIERQIERAAELNSEAERGPVVSPWIAWGPYLWADGETPRSDGLTWLCSDLRPDGAHPTAEGQRKVAVLLLEHFLSAPTAVPWFSPTGEAADIGEVPPIERRQADRGSDSRESPSTSSDRDTTRTRPSSSTVPTTERSDDSPSGEAQNESRAQSDDPRSPTSASTTLILAVIVLVGAVAAGTGAMVYYRRRNDAGDR